MPRQARVLIDNSCYHIVIRGNGKRDTFKDYVDFVRYYAFLTRYKSKYDTKIYGWCFMHNHVHMVVESPRLSKFMHGINMSYAKYFHYRHKGVGHLWQDRYKSYLIQKDKYLINCITYIEYNPVRAGMVNRPEDYRWSSYSARILGVKDKLLDQIIL